MDRSRRRPTRKRVGQVSYYQHHGGWCLYYREGSQRRRMRVAECEADAAALAAQVNGQLAARQPTWFSFTPLSVAELQRRFIDRHEHVRRSSLATVSRYRTATQHFVEFYAGTRTAHEVDAEAFVRYLRTLRVAPNGHPNSTPRPLRDKGINFILQTCRTLYGYAAKKRHLPPYAENPFAGLGGRRAPIDDAKPIFVFDADTELRFFQQADEWLLAEKFLMAKTGMRPAEVTHLLIEDLDLAGGWLTVRNKPKLGWKVKSRKERNVPLIDELVQLLAHTIGARRAPSRRLRSASR